MAVVALLFLMTACGEEEPGDAGNGSSDTELNPESLTYNVYQLLRASGNTVEIEGIAEDDHFEPQGRILALDGGKIVVFEYSTSEDVEEVVAKFSEDGRTIGGEQIAWNGTPHLYKTSKVIVVYQGDNQSILDALELAVGTQFAGG